MPSAAEPTPATPRPRGRRILRRVAAASLALVLAGAGAGLWGNARRESAAANLSTVGDLMRQLEQRMRDGEAASAQVLLARLQRHTAAARADTGDPLWRFGGHVPWLGANLRAVRTVALALDDLAQRGLPELVTVAASLNPATLAPRNGRVDLAVLTRHATALGVARDAVSAARDRVTAIGTAGLLPAIRDAIEQLSEALSRAATTIATAARTAVLLPPMLGNSGPRTYLVLFQNNAELRATGGMPGAFIVVSADRGRLSIVDEGNASYDLKGWRGPIVALDAPTRALYTDKLATFPADINLGPDFPTAASLARRMYQRASGRTVDGVFATDPVAMAQILRATGPVAIAPGTTLTADNAIKILLSDAYAAMDMDERKERFLTGAARAVFAALTVRPGDPSGLVRQLAVAAGQRRILAWSARPQEQALLVGTVLAGALPTQEGPRMTVGVFLNDGSGAKLGYYLTEGAALRLGVCRADGRRELHLSVRLTSSAPRSGLPSYVLGLGLSGNPYTVRTNVLMFSPLGGSIVRARLDGSVIGLGTGIERNRFVGVATVDVKPGATRTLEVTMLTGVLPHFRLSTIEPALWTTPTISPWQLAIQPVTPCG